MTVQELRKELIRFEDEKCCSKDCGLLKNIGNKLSGQHFKCLLNSKHFLTNTGYLKIRIFRCQRCIDLFKLEIK